MTRPHWRGTGFQRESWPVGGQLHAAGTPEDVANLQPEGVTQEQVQSAMCRDICSLDTDSGYE